VRARIALVAVAALALSGCGDGGETGGYGDRTADRETRERAPDAPLTPSHCPPGLRSCRTTEGRIVFVERVDPDGDGDAHFVLIDPQGISLPGITAVDVRRGLRPDPLPGIGERISAAGPVQTGSYGQRQIHAIELHVAGE
jgi:hypothetical protein